MLREKKLWQSKWDTVRSRCLWPVSQFSAIFSALLLFLWPRGTIDFRVHIVVLERATIKGQQISKANHEFPESSKKGTKHTQDSILSEFRSFFWKNQKHHNLLLRFTDLLICAVQCAACMFRTTDYSMQKTSTAWKFMSKSAQNRPSFKPSQ